MSEKKVKAVLVELVQNDFKKVVNGTETIQKGETRRYWYRIDIFMRMLTPRELARAHSVQDDFVITGNKTEQTKQVGNSVPARTARALVRTLLERYAK